MSKIADSKIADRSQLIRLASSMEKGSDERRAILAGLEKHGFWSSLHGPVHHGKAAKLIQAGFENMPTNYVKAIQKQMGSEYDAFVETLKEKRIYDLHDFALRRIMTRYKGLQPSGMKQTFTDVTEALEGFLGSR